MILGHNLKKEGKKAPFFLYGLFGYGRAIRDRLQHNINKDTFFQDLSAIFFLEKGKIFSSLKRGLKLVRERIIFHPLTSILDTHISGNSTQYYKQWVDPLSVCSRRSVMAYNFKKRNGDSIAKRSSWGPVSLANNVSPHSQEVERKKMLQG